MKKFIVMIAAACLLTGCGVGTYTVSSGMADKAELSFVAPSAISLDVKVDESTYGVSAVKQKAWKQRRNIKKTAKNTLSLPVGQHRLSVSHNGQEILSKTIFVSAGEHKVIEL